jgi:hypothetical protein
MMKRILSIAATGIAVGALACGGQGSNATKGDGQNITSTGGAGFD